MLRPALATVLAALLLASCAKEDGKKNAQAIDDGFPTSNATFVGNIYFDSALNPKERGAIVGAVGALEEVELTSVPPGFASTLKLRAFDPTTLRLWIEERARYIVSEKSDENKLVLLQKQYDYPNPGIIPPQARRLLEKRNNAADQAQVLFTNLGLAIYLNAKFNGGLYGVHADGIGTFPISSPRSGLLMTGPGLFGTVPAEHKMAVKIYNLSILFHEARHSDGNRESTGFPHDHCPEGHELHGHEAAACDHSYNGSYTVSALVLRAYLQSCAERCTTEEKSILAQAVLDAEGRIIRDQNTRFLDDAPEGVR